MLAELALAAATEEELLHLLRGELVGRDAVGQADPVAAVAVAVTNVLSGRCRGTRHGPLQVRSVAAHPGHDLTAGVVDEQRDRVDAAGVDLAEVLRDHPLEPTAAGDGL